MHEWAIAEALVREVEAGLRRNGRVRRVKVILGELQNIDVDVLKQYVEMMIGEVAPGVRVEYEVEPTVFRCRRCGHTWTLSDLKLGDEEREYIHFVPESVHAHVKCPRCGSRDFEVVQGRGVRLVFEVE
ncbi:hydrogenase nickel incorporation protein HypA [Stetteria hydrogenophila]